MSNRSRIVIFNEPGKPFEIKEVPLPQLISSEILIKVNYVTLCKSDINTYTGKRKEKSPTILGHEISGSIAGFGDNHTRMDFLGNKLSEGDKITWSVYSSNPGCKYSTMGIPQKGEGLFKYGHEQVTEKDYLHGGLADFIALKNNTTVIKLSDKIPNKISAILNCSIATVTGALRAAGEVKGKRILISGAGMLGISCSAIAHSLGAEYTAVSDPNKIRLETAEKFGASDAFYPYELPEKDKFDIIIETSGVPASMELTLGNLDIGGIAVWLGATFPQNDLSINAEKLIRNVHTIKGLHNYNNDDLVNAVNFIENNYDKYPFEELIYDGFSLEETEKAFEFAVKENPYRVGIKI